MSEEELRPCPFCGETATLDYSVKPNGKHWFITCDRCGMMYQDVISQRKYVKDGWNTRPIEDALKARIAELERDKKALRGIEENLREHIDIGTLQLSVATARIAELKAYIDQLIEIGGWAITGITIATSYSPGEMQNLAEKKSDDWYALIKNLKECDKEKEREE